MSSTPSNSSASNANPSLNTQSPQAVEQRLEALTTEPPRIPTAKRESKSRLTVNLLRDTVSFLSRESTATLQTPDLKETVQCEGYLTKRGHVVTNWKTRYFVLHGHLLTYFADQNTAQEGGKILGQVNIARAAPWSGEAHGFMLFTEKKIPYYVYAANSNERSRWMKALAPFMLAADPVDCEGYLTKRGHLVPSYRTRYFILRGTTLKYYSNEKSYHSDEPAISELELTSATKWDGEPTGMMFTTTTAARFYVYTDTTEEREKWLKTIERIIGAPEPVACAGYLTKQGHKRKSWKKRYFVLRGNQVSYYSDYDTASSNLKAIAQVKVEDVQQWEGEPFGFMFMTTDQVSYYVYADNDRERRKWISALQKVVDPSAAVVVPTISCPKCHAEITGSRFCGACGFKLKNGNEVLQAVTEPTSDVEQADSAKRTSAVLELEETPFDELEALSEGARTLLLAVMQAPDGTDIEESSTENGPGDHPVDNPESDIEARIAGTNALISPDEKDKFALEVGSDELNLDWNLQNEQHESNKDEQKPSVSPDVENPPPSETSSAQKEAYEVIDTEKGSETSPLLIEVKAVEDQKGVENMKPCVSGTETSESNPHEPISSGNAVDPAIQTTADLCHHFEHELDFLPLYLPSKTAPVRCRFYGTMNFSQVKHTLVFISDSGPAGLWRQDQEMSAPKVSHRWSMIEYIEEGLEAGYGIIVCNPFANTAKVYEEGGSSRIVPIPGSSSPLEHIDSVWDKFIMGCKGMVSVIAYARGGVLVKHLIEARAEEVKSKIYRIAFIESQHTIDGKESSTTLEILGRRSINWEPSSEPLGSQLVESQARVGCVCLSVGYYSIDHSTLTLKKAKSTVFSYFQANPDRPGMTAIVACIRADMRKASRPRPKVVVLGETSDSPPPEFGSADSDPTLVQKDDIPMQKKRPGSVPSRVKEKASQPFGVKSVKSPVAVTDFELEQVVGQGGFGKVFLARKLTDPGKGAYFAMKVLLKKQVMSSGLVKTTMAERHILTEISHPFVVKLHYAFQSDTKLYLVMDYLSAGSLAIHLRRYRRFPEEWARFYAAEIATAIVHLHNVNIIYRDAKLENVLLDHTGHVRITDFGLSKVGVSGLQGATTFCGTAAYIAPELLKGRAYGKAADWWSFGILLYEMIAGKPPYYHRNRDIMFQTILKQEWVTFTPAFSDSAVSIIRGLLTRDPLRRLGSGPSGADAIFNHPFFSGIDWKLLLEKRLSPPFNPGVDEIDTRFVKKTSQGVTTRDRQMSVMGIDVGRNEFDGFSFVGNEEEHHDTETSV